LEKPKPKPKPEPVQHTPVVQTPKFMFYW
jgi:hypothetical protein